MELNRETEQIQDTHDYIREATVRYVGPRRKGMTIRTPEDVARFMRSLLKDNAREHFMALFLNGANQVVSYSLVSLGSANYSLAHPREIFQPAILAGACTIVVGHNHPSAELTPSQEDIAVTKRLRDAGNILGIPVLDHVLFTHTDFVSFKDRGLLA